MLKANNRYILTMRVMGRTYTFEFSSAMEPLYADFAHIMANVAGFIGLYLERDQVVLEILKASLAADKLFGLYNDEGEREAYVEAKAELALLNSVMLAMAGRPAKYRLGDLSLDYSNNAALTARINALRARVALYEGAGSVATGSVATASKSVRRASWVEPRW